MPATPEGDLGIIRSNSSAEWGLSREEVDRRCREVREGWSDYTRVRNEVDDPYMTLLAGVVENAIHQIACFQDALERNLSQRETERRRRLAVFHHSWLNADQIPGCCVGVISFINYCDAMGVDVDIMRREIYRGINPETLEAMRGRERV